MRATNAVSDHHLCCPQPHLCCATKTMVSESFRESKGPQPRPVPMVWSGLMGMGN